MPFRADIAFCTQVQISVTRHLMDDLYCLGNFLNDERFIYRIHRCDSCKQIPLMRRYILRREMIERQGHDVFLALFTRTAIGAHAQNRIDILLDELFHGVFDRHISPIPNILNDF